MALFSYKVLNSNGNVIVGIVEAPNFELASEALVEKGFQIINIKENKGPLDLKFSGIPFLNRISKKEIVIFSRQLAVMVSAIVPIIQSLRVIVKQTKNEALQKIVNQIADDVDEGLKFSEALRKHSVFGGFFVNMVASGESSGKLDEVLEYLADEVEKNYDLQSKIKGAMIYPAFIVVGLIVVGIAMMVFVIPQLTGMLTASGQDLPIATKILLFISDIFRNYFVYLILGLIIVGGGLFYFIKKTELGKKSIDLLKLKLPVFGKLFKNIYLVRFGGTLSSLVSAGVSLTNALKITGDVIDNYHYKKLITQAIERVKDGYSVAYVFSKSDMFPQMLAQMLKIGERTGRLADVLEKLSRFYSREVENMVANLTALIEPLIMVIIGIAVGGMVAAIIMPMYNMANSF